MRPARGNLLLGFSLEQANDQTQTTLRRSRKATRAQGKTQAEEEAEEVSAFSLTPKQRSFANNIIAGMNPSEALIKSEYKTDGMTKAAIAVQAQKLLNHPNIRLMIEEAQAKATEEAITLASFTKQKALEWAEEDRKLAHRLGQSGSAVSASRLASDIAGHIVDKKEHTHRDGDFEGLNAEERSLIRDAIRRILDSRGGGARQAGQPGQAESLPSVH